MTSALGIRSEANPLGPEVDKLVAEALAALEKMETEAVASGDPMAGYFAMQALMLRANRALLNGTTTAAAQPHHPVTDVQWRAVRGDLRRTLERIAEPRIDHVVEASRFRSWAILAAACATLLVIGIAAGHFAWPARCIDYSNGTKWCQR
ncbi:hypothetical protein [Acidisphaera sp. S103]|uniref:hypothetical protein n=1 Tax=Acidisphaera sp. S103 TaxID=1747223 RepID=UPI00131C4A18|nr:hypothetical protein [Acidisphaera sp. S103]